ncbi:uncharacterized protein LOC125699214 isoform X3 [Lagopus muta]|uniref:uncharacterized protein LOC125699214 isoform X3 n=1 Tax=Lagopus muta TaxID=64668 RepID=UPI00209C77C4|nr:uncharacterized protein LOC125699214 isoform X3 [Lagopus muta]
MHSAEPSFGILCWESIGRQKPFEGQTAPLGALTGICNSLQPANSEKFISSNLPRRNRLLHFVAVCCHQEQDYRPRAAESADLLNGVLMSISKKEISTAVYNLMHAKETAINACRSSEVYTLQTGLQNSEVICQQKLTQVMSKKVPPVVPNYPHSDKRKPFCTLPLSGPTAGRENCQHKDPPRAVHSPQTVQPEQPVTEVMSIWDSTSEYMLQQFALKKGVAVDVLGTFYILRKRICEGTRPMIVPRFHLSQRVAQAQGLIYTNSDIPDDLKVVPLDYSQLSLKTSLPEKLVKECVNDIVVLFSWGAGLGEDYDLVFKGIGVLMSRNRILTMRYREEFLLAIDQTGAALKCLLANPQTEVCVLSGREPAAFHVCPGGIRVLPGFKIKLPSEIKAGELSPDKEADEKEGAQSYQDKYLHQQKTQPPHHQKGDRAIEGNQKHRRTPMDNGIFSQLLAGLKSRSDAEEGGVREDVYKEQEKEGKAMDESLHGPAGFCTTRGRRPRLPDEHLCLPGSRKHPTAQRRLPPLTLPALPTKALRGEPAPSAPRPKRTEFSHAPSGTQGSAKLLRKLRGEEGQAEEGEGDGRAAGSRKHAQRRLPPVTVLELPADVTQAQPALGAPRPKSALPAIEGSSSKAGKRRKMRQCREKTEIPACKDHQRVGQEVCYLCLQQEHHRLWAAMLEEKEKKERAERAELQDWKTRMAALSQRRARAAWEWEVAKTEKKESLRYSRNYLESLCPTPPGYIRRMEYDRELQERREVWEKERRRVPAKIPLRQ